MKIPILSVILPTLNEAERLPLLLADLHKCNEQIEIIVVDGGSTDKTVEISRVSGCKLIKNNEANRGAQMHLGACHANSNWFLFLHADSRLSNNWSEIVSRTILAQDSYKNAWYFDFKVKKNGLNMRLLESIVFLRSILFQRPYGDQGLLINKNLYNSVGGFASLYLMEDLDFIERVSKEAKLNRLKSNIFTDAKKWDKKGLIKQTLINLRLRILWRRGRINSDLFKEYYL